MSVEKVNISYPPRGIGNETEIERRIQNILAKDIYRRIGYKGQSENGCMLWLGGKTRAGYGRVSIMPGLHILAHRFMWEYHNKSVIPQGMVIMHICDVKACVNPEHLRLGTIAENNLDKIRKGGHNGPKGETHPSAKLTAQKVMEIRLKLKQGISMRKVGKEYGVTGATIERLAAKKTWKHVVEGQE